MARRLILKINKSDDKIEREGENEKLSRKIKHFRTTPNQITSGKTFLLRIIPFYIF